MIKRIVRNFTALFAGEVVARICHFAAVIYLARVLGAEGFGAINFALAVVAYFLMVANMGLGELGIREVARKRDVKEMAGAVISMRLSLAAAAFLGLVLLSLFLKKAPQTVYLVIAYGLTIFPYAVSFEWVFIGTEQMKYNAYGRILNAALYVSAVFLFVRSPADALKVAFIAIAADAVTSLFYYMNYRRKFGDSLRLRFEPAAWLPLARVSSQLFISSAMIIIYLNFGTVALGFFRDERTVGIFAAAAKLVTFFFALSTVIVTAVFPIISSLYHESRERLDRFLSYCAKLTLMLGIPVGVGATIIGPRIIGLVYGPSYAEAGPLFRIMGWFAAINLTSYVISYSLVACDRQADYLKILVSAAVLNIVLNLAGTPFFGYYAPSVALVLTEAMIFIWSVFALERVAPISFFRLSVKPLIASLVMAGFLFIPLKVNVLVTVVMAAVAYFAVLFGIGGFDKKEMELVKGAFA